MRYAAGECWDDVVVHFFANMTCHECDNPAGDVPPCAAYLSSYTSYSLKETGRDGGGGPSVVGRSVNILWNR